MRTETAGCLEVLSVEGQNGDVMMRRDGKWAGGERGGCFSDRQTDFPGFSLDAGGPGSVICLAST